ncbi:MAG TPA: FKBP-type peptidyl-prolyl cis-trans isomerase [Flavipsychrobacter sp.]|nr:FKBP-type peptidyl-prolyl cis-trans isomerase [Flavipsychrobacter sp.]
MIKQVVSVALLAAAFVTINACNKPSFKKLSNGLEYSIIKDEKGDKKPAVGDIVELNIRLKADDSLLADSRVENGGNPVQTMIQESQFKGDWTNALKFLTKGDSAVIKVSIDSLRAFLKDQSPLPPFLDGKKQLIYELKVVGVKTQKELEEEMKSKSAEQNVADDKILQNYFAKNNLQPTKTSSGLYYIIEKEGTGELAAKGKAVTVNYTGSTMDGKVFDSNTDPKMNHVEPFTFTLGNHEVIEGWDEGVAQLKKGSKAKLFIPSSMAYGEQGREPMIPKNAILIFDVGVTNITNAPTADVKPEAAYPAQ